MRTSLFLILVMLLSTAYAEQVMIHRSISAPVVPGLGMPAGEVVKNAPVHAKLTTRSVRELCDGNRIVNEQVEVLYRDSTGRERREMGSDGERVSFIRDGRSSYMLHPAQGIAVPLGDFGDVAGAAMFMPPGVAIAPEIEIEFDDVPEAPAAPPAPGHQVKVIKGVIGAESGGSGVGLPHEFIEMLGGGGDTEVEPLGQKKIKGLRVEGTKRTTTFAAGSLGNEKPIQVVKTTWYSPELRMMIRSEEYDPRAGTVIYDAEVLGRDEPDESLFVVPDDFKQPGKLM